VKAIVLCADDFGQSAAISAGILELVRRRRLSAVSCLTEAEHWPLGAVELGAEAAHIDIGLHFNLTHGFARAAVPAEPLGSVMRSALTGRIERQRVATALHAQLDRFEAALQRAPDFVDGHQHVHMLPGIRAVFLTELARRYRATKPYVRAVAPKLAADGELFKTAVLKLLGAGFGSAARSRGFATNSGFAGIYSLLPSADFGALMRRWIAAAHSGDLLMCHPGAAATDAEDPIASTRPLELAFLQSDAFEGTLRSCSARLSRLRDI
jgi:predicted glycoside hydrolase/deacetylase ChbG (UPF0249 family)